MIEQVQKKSQPNPHQSERCRWVSKSAVESKKDERICGGEEKEPLFTHLEHQKRLFFKYIYSLIIRTVLNYRTIKYIEQHVTQSYSGGAFIVPPNG